MDSFFPASFISHYYIAYKLGRISYENFIYGYTDTSIETAAIGAIALNAEVIGNYLQAHTAPDDLIYLATESVQSYYYADRKPPVEILWPDFLFVTGSADQVFDPAQSTLYWISQKEWSIRSG